MRDERNQTVAPAAEVTGRKPSARRNGASMFSGRAWEEIQRSLKLSGRELQLVRGVFDDQTESCIAAELGISSHTVHTYFERLHHKLAVTDRVELVLRVMNGFLTLTASSNSILPSLCGNRTANRCPLQSRT